MNYYYWGYNYQYYSFPLCNTTLLHGIKRALEVSPNESFILVLSSGSMADSNDSQLLNEIYSLLDEKQSQVFMMVYTYCVTGDWEATLLNEIAYRSYGQVLSMDINSLNQAISGLDLFLTKPLHSSVRILNMNASFIGESRHEFEINESLTFLLISTSGDIKFTLVDPLGNSTIFEKTRSHVSGHSYLVKHPPIGLWSLDSFSSGNVSARIWGFSASGILGNCSICHPNATCEEFGGDQECTCKPGFSGDGSLCYDVNECEDYWILQCNNGYCVNSIGNDRCYCFSGYTYEVDVGCIDIDECATAQLNDCHPLAVCTNHYGWYSCSCPYGYFGDGKYCDINECEQGTPCGPDMFCNKFNASYTCLDPCSNYAVIDEEWRSISYRHYYYGYAYNYRCDYHLKGWYRFQGRNDQQIPEYCVPVNSCGTQSPMWLNGEHPTIMDGVVNRTVCANWDGHCCLWSTDIKVKACSGGYYVYKLNGTPTCYLAFCTESISNALNCSYASCAPDEECGVIHGVPGCHCKLDSPFNNGLNLEKYLSPDLICGSNQIRLSYSKCLLERLGYDTTTIHLKDNSCTSFIEREDISKVKMIMIPRNGSCGAYLHVNESHITYINTVYLSPKSDAVIKRNEALINFYCSYPKNMEVSLWVAVNPMISSVSFTFGGTGKYSAKMALFQYSDYSTPYQGPEVWLTTTSMLYVGVMVEEAMDSQFVLVMKNCYATPTAENWHPVKYYIIKNNCLNRNDPTISIDQNGQSYQGCFSLQVFKFIGNYDQVYLHCEVRLCDTTFESCFPQCSGVRSLTNDGAATQNLTIGPLRLQGSAQVFESAKPPAALSSSEAKTPSMAALILTVCSFLITYI
ncbi:uromodulin-like [Discoglossus pictus]